MRFICRHSFDRKPLSSVLLQDNGSFVKVNQFRHPIGESAKANLSAPLRTETIATLRMPTSRLLHKVLGRVVVCGQLFGSPTDRMCQGQLIGTSPAGQLLGFYHFGSNKGEVRLTAKCGNYTPWPVAFYGRPSLARSKFKHTGEIKTICTPT